MKNIGCSNYKRKTLYSTCKHLAAHALQGPNTLTFVAPSKIVTTEGHLLQERRHFGPECESSTSVPLPP